MYESREEENNGIVSGKNSGEEAAWQLTRPGVLRLVYMVVILLKIPVVRSVLLDGTGWRYSRPNRWNF